MSVLPLRCPRCNKGAGLLHIIGKSKPRKFKCKNCLDEYRILGEKHEDGRIEVTWELRWSKWPIPEELKA